MNDLNSSPIPRQGGLTLPKNAPPAFHIMSKPTGAIYNLDCKYCFFLSIVANVKCGLRVTANAPRTASSVPRTVNRG